MSDTQAASKWQPIASAPKDAGLLLLLVNGISTAGGWVSDVDHGADWEGQLGMAGWWHFQGSDAQPTHWQPLPPPI